MYVYNVHNVPWFWFLNTWIISASDCRLVAAAMALVYIVRYCVQMLSFYGAGWPVFPKCMQLTLVASMLCCHCWMFSSSYLVKNEHGNPYFSLLLYCILLYTGSSSVNWLAVSCICVIVQKLCESRGGRPRLSVLTRLLVSVDVKNYWTVPFSALVTTCP